MDRLLRAILFAILIAYGYFFLYHAMRTIAFPLDADNSEGYLLNEARLWGQGKNPYRDFHSPPHLIANYPPLYPLILALPVRFGGLSFIWGRALSALSVLGICVIIYLILWGRTRSYYWSAIGAFLFPSFYHVYSWGPLHRVDIFGLYLVALGLLAVERRARIVWPAILFVAAVFTRQTYVGPVLVTAWFLARTGEKRRAAWLLGSFVGATALLFGVATLLTRGEFFRHTILYNMNDYRWENTWVYQLHLWRYSAVFVAFGLGLMIARFRERVGDWLPAYLLLSWLVSLAAGKVGSAENYLLELVFSLSLAVPLLALRLRRALAAEHAKLAFFVPLLLIFGCLQNFHLPRIPGLPGKLRFFEWRYDYAFTPSDEDYAAAAALLAEGKRISGPVLSQFPGWALLSGHEVFLHTFLARQLAAQDRFDENILLSRVRKRSFQAILISDDLGEKPDPGRFREGNDRFSGDFYQALIKAGYTRSVGFIGRYYLYRPRPQREPVETY